MTLTRKDVKWKCDGCLKVFSFKDVYFPDVNDFECYCEKCRIKGEKK